MKMSAFSFNTVRTWLPGVAVFSPGMLSEIRKMTQIVGKVSDTKKSPHEANSTEFQ
jgi:hypothetical protein